MRRDISLYLSGVVAVIVVVLAFHQSFSSSSYLRDGNLQLKKERKKKEEGGKDFWNAVFVGRLDSVISLSQLPSPRSQRFFVPEPIQISRVSGFPTIFDKNYTENYTGCCVNGTPFSRAVWIITSRYVTRV